MRPHLTEPHAAQTVVLIEDDENPANRIYEIRDNPPGQGIGILGSELDSLAAWWGAERSRRTRVTQNDLAIELKPLTENSYEGRYGKFDFYAEVADDGEWTMEVFDTRVLDVKRAYRFSLFGDTLEVVLAELVRHTRGLRM